MSTIRIQAKFSDEKVQVKSLIKHPMETGTRKDSKTGELIPAQYIEEVKCEHNGNVVMTAMWGPAISRNPYWAFSFKGGKAKEYITISWRDNQGNTDSLQAEIR